MKIFLIIIILISFHLVNVKIPFRYCSGSRRCLGRPLRPFRPWRRCGGRQGCGRRSHWHFRSFRPWRPFFWGWGGGTYTAFNSKINIRCCEAKLNGGRLAEKEEVLYAVNLMINYTTGGKRVCGATYVGTLWILTAANCLDNNENNPRQPPDPGPPDRIQAQMGVTDWNDRDKLDQVKVSIGIIIHPDYSRNGTHITNNIGLVKIGSPFNDSNMVKQAILPDKPIVINTKLPLTISGWVSKSNLDLQKPRSPDKLHIANATVLKEPDHCVNNLTNETIICIGVAINGSNTGGYGDPGSALIYNSNIIIGIASFMKMKNYYSSDPCEMECGVYEDVFSNLPWIRKYVPDVVTSFRTNSHRGTLNSAYWSCTTIQLLNIAWKMLYT